MPLCLNGKCGHHQGPTAGGRAYFLLLPFYVVEWRVFGFFLPSSLFHLPSDPSAANRFHLPSDPSAANRFHLPSSIFPLPSSISTIALRVSAVKSSLARHAYWNRGNSPRRSGLLSRCHYLRLDRVSNNSLFCLKTFRKKI
jgi:hypothetical protein